MATPIVPINKTTGMLAHAGDDYEEKINELVVMVNNFLIEAKQDIASLSDANKLSLAALQGSETAFIDSFNALVDTVNATVTKVNTFLKESEETVRAFTADELNDTNSLQLLLDKTNDLVNKNNTLNIKISEVNALITNVQSKVVLIEQTIKSMESSINILKNGTGEKPTTQLVANGITFPHKVLNRGRHRNMVKIDLTNILTVDAVVLHLTIEMVIQKKWETGIIYVSATNNENAAFRYSKTGDKNEIIKIPITLVTEKKEFYYRLYSNKFGYVNINIDSVEEKI